MEIFNVYWTNHKKSKNYIIGILAYDKNWYFKYNKKDISTAIEEGYRPFPDMPDINRIYESKELFPVFSMRYFFNDSSQHLTIMKNSVGDLVTDKILIKYLNDKKKG